jgi:mannonate dehydratase
MIFIQDSAATFCSLAGMSIIPAYGITLCTGLLRARPDNDLPGMIARPGDRLHFLHLRNVKRETNEIAGSFYEANHLAGDNDMVAIIAAALRDETRPKITGRADCAIHVRPDHGQDILDDLDRDARPGYPATGRLKGLAEVRDFMIALSHSTMGLKA